MLDDSGGRGEETRMRELHCPLQCGATIRAENDDEVMQQAASHAAEAHPDLELNEDTQSQLRSLIHAAQ